MLFNSYEFVLIFLPILLILYYAVNRIKKKNVTLVVLIVASLFFYAFGNIKFIFVILGSVLINWIISVLINRLPNDDKKMSRKLWLFIGIAVNILIILIFKYYNFFVVNVNNVFHATFDIRNIFLPLGISFYTFQQISYIVDTYRGETKDYSFLEYAAFVTFFPQLVAGPIVMHDELIPQFRDESRRRYNADYFSEGLYYFSIGMFKKVWIADTFSKAVNMGWSFLDSATAMELIIIMLSYTFQIYFDFSAYSDMAIGLARMFNIELPINFNSPYKSLSIKEFWDRWHMTLTRFLTKYIYIPLGGSRKGKFRTYANIFIVFLISGFWHGASWTFIFWGVCHGVAMILYRLFEKTWNKCNQVFQWLCTFAFVNVMWFVFRADSIRQALSCIKRMLLFKEYSVRSELIDSFKIFDTVSSNSSMWIIIALALFIVLNCKNIHENKENKTIFKAVAAAVLLFISILNFEGVTEFIYFNF